MLDLVEEQHAMLCPVALNVLETLPNLVESLLVGANQ
jgi:hypothetical protein